MNPDIHITIAPPPPPVPPHVHRPAYLVGGGIACYDCRVRLR